jgi:enamine deaminase RidA (YjgF/YER057c/UK114 family)
VSGPSLTRIERTEEPWPLMAQAVVSGSLATMCFVPLEPVPDFAGQVRQVFARLDEYLAKAGASRATLLTAQVWLRDIGDFAAFVPLWNGWVDAANSPVLSIIGSHLGRETVLVEIKVTAYVGG